MNAVGVASVAAVVYGAGDFFGGLASRRIGSLATVAYAQALGLLGVLTLLGFVPQTPTYEAVGWGVATGVAAALGIGCLYAALAVGNMGVVSPISAVLGASVPVFVRIVAGDRPHATASLGCALALAAVLAASATPGRAGAPLRRWLPLTIASGVGFAAFYLTLAHARPATTLVTIAVARLTSASIFGVLTLRRTNERRRIDVRAFALLVITATCDTLANVFYAAATQSGSLALVVVVTSLYPASTVVLAYLLLRERLTRLQWAGVASALLGAALIAVG